MTTESLAPRPATPLGEAFATALGTDGASTEAQSFVRQAEMDFRVEELPSVQPADLGQALSEVWLKARAAAPEPGPQIALRPLPGAGGAVALDLVSIIQPDQPFLVDSVMGELASGGFDVRAMFHPVVQGADGARLSTIAVVLEPVGEDRREALFAGLRLALSDAHAAVDDFDAMAALMRRTRDALRSAAPTTGAYPLSEHLALLDWLADHRFVFLGARSYDYPRDATGGYLAEEPTFDPSAGLGVLRDPERAVLRRASELSVLSVHFKADLERTAPVVVAKSNLLSRVHRRAHMDYVGVKRYGADGQAIGEVRFVGLLTLDAYEARAIETPLIRCKVEHVLDRAGETPSAYTGKRLRNILETYPRDELFQIDADALYDTAMGVLHLYDRPRVRLFARRDEFDRFVSILLYVPKERFDAEVQTRAGRLLARAYGGRVSATYPSFGGEALARVHFVIGVRPGDHAEPDLATLEQAIAEQVRTWSDRFEAQVRRSGALGPVGPLLSRYAGAFPAGYRDRFAPDEALADLDVIETLSPQQSLKVRAYRTAGDSKLRFHFKLYHLGEAVPLADVLPILENMGLKALTEDGFPVMRSGDDQGVVWVHDFELEDERGERLVFADIRAPFEETFSAIWKGETESDGFNRLVLELGVSWREAALMRTVARYRQQSGLDPTQAVQTASLAANPGVARLILDLFKIKFDPALDASLEERTAQAEVVFADIVQALQQVASLDADRVLRRLALVVRAMQRTNYYQTGEDGRPKPYISFKVASRELEDLPAPKPFREIFIWSPQVEGVHLRFGPVARGGLRWSDRRDDFRTEVLGLVKAQQVKNAVIVPVGSKGGFYPKQLPRSGEVRAEGIAAYKTFLHGLLDITDNLDASGAVVPPDDVIRHDGDDPYLVVAADKGTATFSDIANGVAADYGFWLGDAFASGGSVGYDHKAMAITARGAWEAIKRHFREMGQDIQATPFTMAGVGDMSGDVFGNGALLSRATKLVAAFDHRHIFLDPDPDAEASWAERKRLFDLPRSSWDDYDRTKLSHGGGVFPRTAKTVPLTDQVRALLGVEGAEMAPADLIRAILKAQVDLLYLGGIGTYVKSPAESDAEVGDKANDTVRVDAGELRCKVVGEGANLGVTQAGRIAYARSGGRIDTDAIDNSAGVDTSDHEVNIKILAGQAERARTLQPGERDPLLASMTDEVARHVLAHNYAQTLSLSLQEATAPADIDAHERFMLDLEAAGRLDRRVEGLPRAAAFTELRTAGRGLSRPELAVITAYAKLELSAEIVAGAAPDDSYFEKTLRQYFPSALARFEDEMKRHRLRREIISTVLANVIVDMVGPTFPSRLQAAIGCDAAGLVAAFEAARQVFRLDEIWLEIDALDLQVPPAAQLMLYQEAANSLRGQTFWIARHVAGKSLGVAEMIDRYRPAADALLAAGDGALSAFERDGVAATARRFIDAGAPEPLARKIAGLRPMTAATEIADLAASRGWPTADAARLWHATGERFGFDRLRGAAGRVSSTDAYERQAIRGLIVDLVTEQTERTGAVADLAASASAPAADALAAWTEPRHASVERARRVLDDIDQAADGWSFAKLTIANSAVKQAAAGV